MNKIKQLIARNFGSFAYFYSYLRYRIFIAVCLSICVGILDGFGLSMFLPLLQMVDNEGDVDSESLGELDFLVHGLDDLGISLTLISVLAVMTAFFVFKGLAQIVSKSYRVILQQQFIRNMRLKMLDALNRISFKKFIKSDVGRIQNTMTGEVERVSQAYDFYFYSFEQSILVVVYMTFAFFIDFQFALLVSVGGALTNILYKTVYKKTKGASKQLTKDSHVYQGQVIQHVANYKYLKATGLTEFFAKKLKRTIKLIEISRKKIGFYSAFLEAAREPLLITVVSVVILIEVRFLGGSLGAILLSLLFFYRALSCLVGMQNAWNRFLERSGSLENVVNFQRDLESQPLVDGEENLREFKEEIVLSNLTYGYDHTKVIKGLNLRILKNESIAFVGESGSGKTTLVNIIAGLLPVDQRHITIDGIAYKDLQLSSLQRRIGYITQEPVIFNDTIFNNVTFWDEKKPENMRRFRDVLEKASLRDFLRNLPAKEETMLGSNGTNLSGGQKQRISIARELYKKVDILIMDEATSALDSETERIIQENIDNLKGNYTVLIVAHRLSTIKNVDKVVVMNEGRIEKEGSYQELLEKLPRFKKMVELQKV